MERLLHIKHATTTESETNRLEIQTEALNRQIDEAVYELYGLTEEEIRIVEVKNVESVSYQLDLKRYDRL